MLRCPRLLCEDAHGLGPAAFSHGFQLPHLCDARQIGPALSPRAPGSVCRIRPQEGLRCKGQRRQLCLAVRVLRKMRVCSSAPKLPTGETSACLPIWAFPI